MQKLQGLLDLLKEAAPNLVLIPQVIIGDEKPDFDSGPADEVLRPLGKQETGCPFQVGAFDQVQVLQDGLAAILQDGRVHSSTATGVVRKELQGILTAILGLKPG